MICKIADLLVEVPECGGMDVRCEGYRYDGKDEPDIVIRKELYDLSHWPTLSEDSAIYMESGMYFYFYLLAHSGMMLHASAVELDGKAYLFSGNSGMGKSTHTRLWQQIFGEKAQVFNDDKPALRRIDGKWYAYGTPWCGKDGINQNKKVPLAGICFLQQAQENKIRRLNAREVLSRMLAQTLFRFQDAKNLDLLLSHVDKLVREIPVFELENRPEPDAARLSYEIMRRTAEEEGL